MHIVVRLHYVYVQHGHSTAILQICKLKNVLRVYPYVHSHLDIIENVKVLLSIIIKSQLKIVTWQSVVYKLFNSIFDGHIFTNHQGNIAPSNCNATVVSYLIIIQCVYYYILKSALVTRAF